MKRLLMPLALLFSSLALALLLGEGLLRAIGYSAPVWYQPDRVLGWTLRPGLQGWFTREGRSFVRISHAGRRDAGHALHKPADVYRIAVLGDSYAEAMQVAREEAFWALLPPRLAACGFAGGRKVEVLNFGVSGFGTAQAYLMLQTHALRYAPDLVLLQFTNGNDVKDNSFALDENRARPFFLLEPDGSLRADDSFAASPGFRRHASLPFQAARRLSDSSRVLQLVRQVRSTPMFQEARAEAQGIEQGLEPVVLAPPRSRAWEDAWRVTERLIVKTRELAERNGARFLLVSVPYAIQVYPDAGARAALAERLEVPDLLYPDRRLAEMGRRHGVAVLPLAPAMQRLAEQGQVFFHGFENVGMGRGHWNPRGHRAAADLIAERLCKGL